jgi:hypothetical protein
MATSTSIVPAARFEHLVMTEAGGEVLVYDETSHHIHRLNQASATVWRLCDGRRTVAALASESGMTVEMVQVALGKLADARLLDGDLPAGARAAAQSRRSFLRKAAVAGVAVPVIASVSAPDAAASHSTGNCIPALTDVPSATTANGGPCAHCCPPPGFTEGFCFFQPVFPFGVWRCSPGA